MGSSEYYELRSKIWNNLKEYKESVLGLDNTYYIGKNKYFHILPNNEKSKKLNLINNGFYSELEEIYYNPNIKNHRDFHHLNSSQAFAYNLFTPLQTRDYLSVFTGLEHNLGEFEKVAKDYTNFDYFITVGEKTFSYEVKYTEYGFGGISTDGNYEDKYPKFYKESLEEMIEEKSSEEIKALCLSNDYQLWRNISFAVNPNHTTCFVFPKFRESDLGKKVEDAKKMLKKEYRDGVKVIYVDEIVNNILLRKIDDENLIHHYNEFFDKYLRIN